MPHVSKYKISKEVKEQIDEKVIRFLTDTSIATRKEIFYEIFTRTERIMIAKRIAMIYMINKNIPPYTISRTLKVSSSTIFRFRKEINNKKFKTTIFWTESHNMNPILKLLFEIASVPLEVRKKSLQQIIESSKR